MKSGLHDFGTDFGNGERDQLFFQRDKEFPLYKEAKMQIEPKRHWSICKSTEHHELHKQVFSWIIEKQEQELNIRASPTTLIVKEHLEKGENIDLTAAYLDLSLNVQEDLALVADKPSSSLIVGNISMPSFWAPERIQGASFRDIHTPVPKFPKNDMLANKLNHLISNKGPFVRFAWTIANDDRLDHHPDKGRVDWAENQELWLRIERQVTVPFHGLGSLFLIRTYLYPIVSLNKNKCQTIYKAIENMPEEISKYKGLWKGKDYILESLTKLF